MKVRFVFHTGKGPNIRNGFGRWLKAKAISVGIIGWTAVLAVVRLDWKILKYSFDHVEIWWPDKECGFGMNSLEISDACRCHLEIKGYLDSFLNQKGIVGWYTEQYNKESQSTLFIENIYGECFSSTTRGNAKGVRIAPASEVLKHPERWMYIECDFHGNQMVSAKRVMNNANTAKYDYWGLFGFFSPFNIEDDSKWYCSEICAYIAFLLGVIDRDYKRISPRRLAGKLAKRWGEPKELK